MFELDYNHVVIRQKISNILFLLMLALVHNACTTKPAIQSKSPLSKEQEAISSQLGPKAEWPERSREVLMNAINLSGIRYKPGGNSPESGFDCSGFVRYVYQQAVNLTLPHSAKAISQIGKSIPKHELEPGDLVFFNTLKSAFSHVGIYLGNNRFIHAPSSGGAVRIESMNSDYWQRRFDGAQRIEISAKAN